MKSLKIPFNESIGVEITNAKNQRFRLWFEPAITVEEILYSFNHRLKLYQPLLLIVNKEDDNFIYLNYEFDAELIFINHQHKVSDIQFYSRERQKSQGHLKINTHKYVIIASPGFAELFSIITNQSSLYINKNVVFSIEALMEPIQDYKDLTSNAILEAILSEKEGTGLRSSYPSYYVWYHDLLFLVSEMGFPGYSASAPVRAITTKLKTELDKIGITSHLRKAVYQRHFMSQQDLISKEATWYGMENMGKFIRTNSRISI